MNPLTWLGLAIILAVLLDLYILRVWNRRRRMHQGNPPDAESAAVRTERPIVRFVDPIFHPALSRFDSIKNSLARSKVAQISIFLSGVGFVAAGQYFMARHAPIEALVQVSQRINDRYRIDLKNLDNVIVAVALLLLGGVLYAHSTRGLTFTGKHSESRGKSDIAVPKYDRVWLACMIAGCGGLIFLLIRSFLYQANIVDTVVWVISTAAFLVAAFVWDRTAGTSPKLYLSSSEIIQLLLIFILGLFVGVYQLQDIPDLLMGDEGTFFETAWSIALGDYRPSPFEAGVYSFPIFGSFWQAGVLKIFGTSLWSWRFASVLPSMLTVFPLYLLSRDLFGRGVGIAASFVFISSPYHLAFARLGYNNAQSVLVVALCVWFLYLGMTKSSFFYSVLAGAAAGFGFLTYTAGRLGLVIACLYFLSFFLVKKIRFDKRSIIVSAFIPFIVGFVTVAAPYLLHNQQNSPETSRYKILESLFFNVHYGKDFYGSEAIFSYAPAFEIDGHEFFFEPEIYAELIVRGIARSLLAFHHQDMVSEHFISDSFSGPIAAVYYSLGGFLILWRLRDRRFLLVAIWFASGLFFLSMINSYPPRHQHLVPVIPAMAIMIGLGVVAFSKQLASFVTVNDRIRYYLEYSLAALIVISIGVVGLREYFVEMPKMYRPNVEQVMNWFGLHNPPDVDFVFISDQPDSDEWRPYFFRTLLDKHSFTKVDLEAFAEDDFGLHFDTDSAVFFGASDAEQIRSELLRMLPNAEEIAFRNRDQDVIGRAVIIGDVTIPASVSFLSGVMDVLTSPVMWLLCPLLVFIGFHWLTHRQELDLLALAGLRDEFVNSAPEKVSEHTRFLEIGIFVRFGDGDQIHRFEPKISIPKDQPDDSSTGDIE